MKLVIVALLALSACGGGDAMITGVDGTQVSEDEFRRDIRSVIAPSWCQTLRGLSPEEVVDLALRQADIDGSTIPAQAVNRMGDIILEECARITR